MSPKGRGQLLLISMSPKSALHLLTKSSSTLALQPGFLTSCVPGGRLNKLLIPVWALPRDNLLSHPLWGPGT